MASFSLLEIAVGSGDRNERGRACGGEIGVEEEEGGEYQNWAGLGLEGIWAGPIWNIIIWGGECRGGFGVRLKKWICSLRGDSKPKDRRNCLCCSLPSLTASRQSICLPASR
ncbi:hypothetical protein CRG98_025941 [Punica granatum]|uniref:Uncharacterized protein n=1 Tax=Punica granatum TaxID=22663 RepID=A0A2I0JCN3_PUNGR|nr:hypothetical protein CRG98_025941 [Punica granatum]